MAAQYFEKIVLGVLMVMPLSLSSFCFDVQAGLNDHLLDPAEVEQTPKRSPEEFPDSIYLNQDRFMYKSINFDPLKFMSIVKYGFLTRTSAQQQGLEELHFLGRDVDSGYYGDKRVPLAQSPREPRFFDRDGYFAFRGNIDEHISFVVNTEGLVVKPRRVSRFYIDREEVDWDDGDVERTGNPGVAFVVGDIPVGAISGVVVPAHWFGVRLKDLSIGLGKTGPVEKRVQSILAELQNELGFFRSTDGIREALVNYRRVCDHKAFLKGGLKALEERKEAVHVIDKAVAEYIERAYCAFLGKEEVRLDDILKLYLPAGIPVYSKSLVL